MPDVVVFRIPEEDVPPGGLANATFPTPPPSPPRTPRTLLVRFWRLLFLPLRTIRSLLLRLWNRLFGRRLKP